MKQFGMTTKTGKDLIMLTRAEDHKSAVNYFSTLNPSSSNQDSIIQMWSFFDSLRQRKYIYIYIYIMHI